MFFSDEKGLLTDEGDDNRSRFFYALTIHTSFLTVHNFPISPLSISIHFCVINYLVKQENEISMHSKNLLIISGHLNAESYNANLAKAYMPGRYQTLIDLVASKTKGEEVRDETKVFSEQQSPYFRWNVKIGYTLNSRKRQFTQQFFLDFQNVTNHKNIFQERYSVTQNKVYKVYQIGFFPDIMWRVQV